MSDAPTVEPDPTPTVSTPTEPTPTDPTPTADPLPEASRSTVAVPVWALVAVLSVVLVVAAFFVGRTTAPSGGSRPQTLAEAVEMTAAGRMEVGDFDARALLQALSQNQDLDLGPLGDLILGEIGRR